MTIQGVKSKLRLLLGLLVQLVSQTGEFLWYLLTCSPLGRSVDPIPGHRHRVVTQSTSPFFLHQLAMGGGVLFFTLNREDFSFVIHLDRQPRTSRRREAQTGSRARSGSRSERTLDAVEHSRTLMEWWPFLIFHRGGLRIKVINNRWAPSLHGSYPASSLLCAPPTPAQATFRLCLPLGVGFHPPDGSPRFLCQSVDTRCPQPPRMAPRLLSLILLPWITGFGTSDILGRPSLSVTRLNRVHLRYGSRLRLRRLRPPDCSESPLLWLHVV